MYCTSCKKTYKNNNSYVDHIKFFHKKESNYRCLFCPSSFSCIYSYKRHQSKCWSRHINNNLDCANNNHPILPPVNDDYVTDNNSIFKYDGFVDEITHKAAGHILDITSHGDVTITRALQFADKIGFVLDPVSKFINDNTTSSFGGERCDILKVVANPYFRIRTPKKFFAYLRKKKLYETPYKFKIHKSLQNVFKKGRNSYEYKMETGTMMNVKLMLQRLLEVPGLFDRMIAKMQILMDDTTKISHFVQGKRWRQIVEDNPGKILFPYQLYHDDYDTGNSQGYKRGKQAISVFNFLLPLLDENEISKLKYVIPACFVKKSISKKVRKSQICSELIELAKDMACNGIEIRINHQNVTVFPILGLIIGDNLAQHELMDFTGSFSHRLMCRFCKMPADERKTVTKENEELLRKKTDYYTDAKDKNSGVSCSSPFNEIPYFHVYDNFSVDLMHDVLEGIIVYGLQNATDTLIRQGYFSVQQLKKYTDNFDYGEVDSRNRLGKDNLDDEGKWRLNAHDSLILLKYFTLLVGKKVPANNSTLQYVIVLEDLVDLIMCHEFDEDKLEQLRQLIDKHGKMYQKFTKVVIDKTNGAEKTVNVTMPPKFHLILHYIMCIIWSGPPINHWSMREEGQNRVYKTYSNVTSCKRNLAFSTAKKAQLMFADLIFKLNERPESFFTYTTREEFIKEDAEYSQQINFPIDEKYYRYNHVVYKGSIYKVTYYVMLNNDLFIISDIITTKEEEEKNIYLILKRVDYKNSEKCYNCYVIDKPTEDFIKKEIQYIGKPFTPFTISDGRKGFKFSKYL